MSRNPRRMKKKGIVVMMIVLIIGSFFIKDSNGLNIYQKILSGSAKKLTFTETAKLKDGKKKRKVLIDAGHGGIDRGYFSPDLKKTEAELNLEIAKKLQKELDSIGIETEMTRRDDKGLAPTKKEDTDIRSQIINQSDADILVSLHCNSFKDSNLAGPIAFYMPGSIQSERLSKMIQTHMNDDLKPKRPKKNQAENFFVLRAGTMPASLVECGFMTNKQEAKNLHDEKYQQRIVVSIASGVVEYLNSVM